MSKEIQTSVDGVIEEFAARGWRPLGVARTLPSAEDGVEVWEYIGVFALFDPPRHDTKETIEAAVSLGVDVKMVTGDHLLIAKETARELGMGDRIYGPDEWKKAQNHSEGAAQELVYGADGFAQVMPEDKYYIVEKLQNRGHVTGMTGDGHNHP